MGRRPCRVTMIEIDEMIRIDSSGGWEHTSAFLAILELSLESRTYGAATMLILG